MVWLADEDAARVKEMVRDRREQKDPQLAHWTAKLLDDRAARSAVIQRLARHLHRLRRRFGQAAHYIDGLLASAHAATREPWPQKLLCPHCGAPVDQVRADHRPEDPRHHVTVHCHVDGVRCDSDAPGPVDKIPADGPPEYCVSSGRDDTKPGA
jgi:hypothetical protein